MKEYLTQKNLIVLGVILVLMVVGVALKQRQVLAPVGENLTPTSLPLTKGEEKGGGLSPDESLSDSGGENIKKLTYDEYLQQGIKYETEGKLNSALVSYENASKLAPTEYVPYSNAGSVYYSMKNYVEAESHFLEAIRISPNNVSVYTKLYEVYFYGMNRDQEQMTAFFQDAMKNTNNSVTIVTLYASYLENIKDYQSALAIWESLLEFEPENTAYKAKVDALQEKISVKLRVY